MDRVRQGIVRRFLAALIDGLLIGVMCGLAGAVLHAVPYLAELLAAVAATAYLSLDVLRGQTVGKRVLGLKIASADGTPASLGMLLERAAIRNAGALVVLTGALTGLSLLNLLAGLVSIAVLAAALRMLRADRLAGYDVLAGTAVYGPAEMRLVLPLPGVTVTPAAE